MGQSRSSSILQNTIKSLFFFSLRINKQFASDGEDHASTNDELDGIYVKNYNRKEARQDSSQRRGAAGRAVGSGSGAVLAGSASGFTGPKVPPESLRRKFYRRLWKNVAEGNSPPRRPIGGGGLPEPSHRAKNPGARKAGFTQRGARAAPALDHY